MRDALMLIGKRTIWKCDFKFEKPSFPHSLFLARHSAVPLLEIQPAFGIFRWSCYEPEGMISSPLLALEEL
jgi:hypothetical protein